MVEYGPVFVFPKNRIFHFDVYECKSRPLRKRIFPLRKRFVWTNIGTLAPERLESVFWMCPGAMKIAVAVASWVANIQCHID